jgi:CheY-like chemotaxis protein
MTQKVEAEKKVSDSLFCLKKRILAVDDRTDNLILLQEILGEEGYDIDITNNGFDALSKIETKPPDLLLLDLEMPEMDGYEVIRRIRDNSDLPFIPILLVTAHGLSYALHALEIGANGCICLPLDINELLEKVKLFLEIKSRVSKLNVCY